ncbi:MAG TPA: hypothetical protein VL358_02175 [Caulobacteraceae bacterium]|jgi:hypothetical protein|nr:hypothetical protein [Caulobacteraceae bacterium]
MPGTIGSLALFAAVLPQLSAAPAPGSQAEGRPTPETAKALFRLTISPLGQVEGCRAVIAGGNPAFDSRACASLMRDQYTPGMDAEGKKIYGVISVPLGAPVLGSSINFSSIDAELALKRMPGGAANPSVTRVAVVIDESGRVESCNPVVAGGVKALDDLACQTGVETAAPKPAQDKSGVRIRSVQSIDIGFASYTPLIFKTSSAYAGLGGPGPYFPERAQRLNVGGYAVLGCVSDPDGALRKCAVQVEAPEGFAFGIASVRMAEGKWMKVAPNSGDHVLVRIEFPPSGNFRAP